MNEESSEYQKQARELAQKLWAIANDLRKNMDASKFKNYILDTIFYDFLSERTEDYAADYLKHKDLTYQQAYGSDEYRPELEDWLLKHLGYIIKPENLYSEFVRKITKPVSENDRFTIGDYEKAVNDLTDSTIGQPSERAFSGLFNDMKLNDPDLGDTEKDRTDLISKVIIRISDIDLRASDRQFDILGTAYMILIGLFAGDAGKKSGEFFTPTGPSRLAATIATLGLDEVDTVADCTCGSASMLLEVAKHLKTGHVGHFYGQESNATYNLARMNMLMHGIQYQNFDIYKGDTITEDKYGDVKMTVQVGNPPMGLRYGRNRKLLNDPRYSGAGILPPKSHADYLFLEHMIYHMDEEDGRVAVIMSHSILFRGGSDKAIRKYIIRDLNRLDAVIGLAQNLFANTIVPCCLLVLRTKRGENSGNILFIDASKEFRKDKKNVLEQKHINKIVDAYIQRKNIPKFAHVAEMKEIIANDYNLNISKYVDTAEEEPEIDIPAVLNHIDDTQKQIDRQVAELNEDFNALGIKLPWDDTEK